MATPVKSALRKAVTDLKALKVRWALIGGLAISVRSVPRFTKDMGFAVAVADDPEAEDVVHPGAVRHRGVDAGLLRGVPPIHEPKHIRKAAYFPAWRADIARSSTSAA
jgi:hypothetical protein